MEHEPPLKCIVGPTASGKSSRAIEIAREVGGEVISVDSRQVYRMLDIGTEKLVPEEMGGVPHHLIDIKDPRETYNAADFMKDATQLISSIRARGHEPILAGGTHFYFDVLLYGLPGKTPPNPLLREELEKRSVDELMNELCERDPRRAARLDPKNKRRLIRALEIVEEHGEVPEREGLVPTFPVEWIVVDVERDALRARIDARLESAFSRGLIEEVARVRDYVGDARLNELGLEYKIVGEYLRGERTEESLLPALSAKLWHYARRQKAWLRKLV